MTVARIFALLPVAALVCCTAPVCVAQADSSRRERPPYDRKEEIIYYNKRYRIHNNYVTMGAGMGAAGNRTASQKVVGADFNFHIRRLYFQVGALMSGDAFMSNNHAQVHVCYGLRWEGKRSNYAVFAGPDYFSSVEGVPPAAPRYFQGAGLHLSAQAVTKFLYDIGIGLEGFADLNVRQRLFGFKIIAFFSGAYRGPKQKYNPNVRSENPR